MKKLLAWISLLFPVALLLSILGDQGVLGLSQKLDDAIAYTGLASAAAATALAITELKEGS